MTATATEVDDLTIPDSPAALEEMLRDPQKMKAIFAEKGKFAEFIRNEMAKWAKVVKATRIEPQSL